MRYNLTCFPIQSVVREVIDGHKRFMMSSRQSVLIAHLLGEKNLSLLAALETTADIPSVKSTRTSGCLI